MAVSPARPDFLDVTSKGKIRVWSAPTIAAGGDTVTVPGIKRVFSVYVGQRSATTYTFTSTGASNTAVVLTLTVTASTTGSTAQTLVVYGQ